MRETLMTDTPAYTDPDNDNQDNQSDEDMSEIEQNRLAELETVVEAGLHTFYEVGSALAEIRDSKLYRETYPNWQAYCRDRWGFNYEHGNRLINAFNIIEDLSPTGLIADVSLSESQLRPLKPLNAEQRREAWQRAVETAPDNDPAKITHGHVQTIVDDMRGIERDNNGRQMKPKINRAANKYVPQGFDACQTPPYAVTPLIPYLDFSWAVWEPAAGEGYMVRALQDNQLVVIQSDILTGENFFAFEFPSDDYDCIVTNPPYTLKYRWLERCYELQKPFALLLPVETLGAKTAQDLFKVHGIEIILLSRRVNFKMPNKGWDGAGAQFPVAWFTWKLSLDSQIVFAELETDGEIY